MTATRFAPGVATAYVSEHVIAVVANPVVDVELMAQCASPEEWTSLLDAFADETDAAIVLNDDDGLRVALVGTAAAEVDDGGHGRRVTGGADWGTHRFAHARAVTLAVGGVAAAAETTHRVDAGIVPASLLFRTFGTGDRGAVDPFDALFGPTAPRTVEAAAVRDTDTDADRTGAPFGVLLFSTGERVIADRTIVVGRNPQLGDEPARPGGERPRCVKLDDPAVSRRHAVIHVDGWHASIDDLGSSNGTWVTAPGRAPVPVRAGHPADLAPGMLVELGGEVSFAVEEVA